MRRQILMAIILMAGVSVCAEAYAKELKIVYVDVKSAIENTKQYRAGQKRLESIKKAKQKELEALRKRINQMDKDLLAQSMAMSPEQLSEKQQEINDMKKKFKRKLQDAQEAIILERNRLLAGINTKFGKLIQKFGKENGYDFILTRPSVLYVDPAHDVTAKVTQRLDAGK